MTKFFVIESVTFADGNGGPDNQKSAASIQITTELLFLTSKTFLATKNVSTKSNPSSSSSNSNKTYSALVTVRCAYCGNQFRRYRGRELFRIRHKKQGPFCCRSCAACGTSRFGVGENNPANVLREQDVLMIREMRNSGHSVSDLIKLTGMSANCIRSIVNYKSWTHLPRTQKIS